MRTVAFVNPKGGAGKTTAALLLALGLYERGARVALVDGDPNRPLVHWGSLPNRPDRVSVHAAPTEQDLPDALREAKGKRPDWIIVDTEGTLRAGMNFHVARPELVLTPLASSMLEALQAVKSAELVQDARRRTRIPMRHVCVFTRLPAALRPRSLREVVEMLKAKEIEILDTPLIEKEAFRTLFSTGGGLEALGATGARLIAERYVAAVLNVLDVPQAASSG